MILDGVVDSDEYFGNKWSNNLSDTAKALSSFFTSCALAGPSACPFWAPTPDAIRTNLTKLTESVRARPVPVFVSPYPSESDSATSYGLLDYPTLRHAIFQSLYSPYAVFPLLAQGLADLAAGNGTLLFQRFGARGDKPPFECSCDSEEHRWDRVMDASIAVFCNDNPEIPGDLEWAEAYFARMAQASDWADVWAGALIACQGWPKFPKTNFRGPFGGNTSFPILFIGNTADPVTPSWGAHKMSKEFSKSVVLMQDSVGHCSTSAPSLCTQRHIRQYFSTGVLPAAGTVCDVNGNPFPILKDRFEADMGDKGNIQEDQTKLAALVGTNDDETGNDQELLSAAIELSKVPFIPQARLAINSAGVGSCR